MKEAKAYANANIALVKYWGKSDRAFNIPAVSSLSMTLDGLGSTVSLTPSSEKSHYLEINGQPHNGAELIRVSDYLEKIRSLYSYSNFFCINSQSLVPIAAGLASSAAFFAALSRALDESLGLNLNDQDLSKIARLGSASAARSIFGGFVGLYGGQKSHDEAFAFPIKHSLNMGMMVAVVSSAKKALSSTNAMNLTQSTSPFYQSFVDSHFKDFADAQRALVENFEQLGTIMEHSTLKMHASMWAAQPSINYLTPQTLALMNLIYTIRKEHGPIAYFTMDAGPNVKILYENNNVSLIKKIIAQSQLASELIISQPGPGAYVVP